MDFNDSSSESLDAFSKKLTENSLLSLASPVYREKSTENINEFRYGIDDTTDDSFISVEVNGNEPNINENLSSDVSTNRDKASNFSADNASVIDKPGENTDKIINRSVMDNQLIHMRETSGDTLCITGDENEIHTNTVETDELIKSNCSADRNSEILDKYPSSDQRFNSISDDINVRPSPAQNIVTRNVLPENNVTDDVPDRNIENTVTKEPNSPDLEFLSPSSGDSSDGDSNDVEERINPDYVHKDNTAPVKNRNENSNFSNATQNLDVSGTSSSGEGDESFVVDEVIEERVESDYDSTSPNLSNSDSSVNNEGSVADCSDRNIKNHPICDETFGSQMNVEENASRISPSSDKKALDVAASSNESSYPISDYVKCSDLAENETQKQSENILMSPCRTEFSNISGDNCIKTCPVNNETESNRVCTRKDQVEDTSTLHSLPFCNENSPTPKNCSSDENFSMNRINESDQVNDNFANNLHRSSFEKNSSASIDLPNSIESTVGGDGVKNLFTSQDIHVKENSINNDQLPLKENGDGTQPSPEKSSVVESSDDISLIETCDVPENSRTNTNSGRRDSFIETQETVFPSKETSVSFRDQQVNEVSSASDMKNESIKENNVKDVVSTLSELSGQRNLRKRKSSQSKSDSNESESVDSDCSISLKKVPRSTSKSQTKNSHSKWQPQIDNVIGAVNTINVGLKRVDSIVDIESEVKEEIIEDCQTIENSMKEKFNIVNFSIKLEKLDTENDEIISPSQKAGEATMEKSPNSRSRTGRLNIQKRSSPGSVMTRFNDRRRVFFGHRASRSVVARNDAKASNQERLPSGAANSRQQRLPSLTWKSSRTAAKGDGDNRRIRRKNGGGQGGDEQDRDRIDFLRSLNLRSRRTEGGGGDGAGVKGILVKPRMDKTPAKKVSFHLPEGELSVSLPKVKEATHVVSVTKEAAAESKPKEKPSTPKSAVTANVGTPATRSTRGKRILAKVPIKDAAPTTGAAAATKRRKISPASAKDAGSDEVVIDENPYEKYEALLDTFKKTVDVWYECTCCSQKYYILENAKQHVRGHFPNCLTN